MLKKAITFSALRLMLARIHPRYKRPATIFAAL